MAFKHIFLGGGVANYISFLVSLKMELVHFPSFFFFSCNFMEKMEIQSDTCSRLCSRSPFGNPNAVYLCPFLMWETEDLRLGESSEDSFPLNSEGNVRTDKHRAALDLGSSEPCNELFWSALHLGHFGMKSSCTLTPFLPAKDPTV